MQFLLLLIAAMFLGGCSVSPSILPELQNVAPTGQQSPLATLVGSYEEMGLFFPNRTTYVFAVDNKRVMSGEEGWGKALPIPPGIRNVTVAFRSGISSTQVALQLQAVAGGRYQVQSLCEIQFWISFGEDTYCDFWIRDIATQKPVTGIVRGLIFSDHVRMSI